MKMYETPHALNDYLDTRFECDCGREHYASLKFVSVRKDALEDLPVFAENTHPAVGYSPPLCRLLTRTIYYSAFIHATQYIIFSE